MKHQVLFCSLLAFCLLFGQSPLHAQTRVTIPIESKDYALVLQTDADQRLGITHFGKRLSDAAEYAGIRATTVYSGDF